MKFALRDYQQLAVDDAITWFASAKANDRRMYAAPTGTGKSLIILTLQDMLGEGCWIVTPRLEIIQGMIDKKGITPPGSEASLIKLADELRISTPIRLRNRLLKGEGVEPKQLIFDESHHDLARSWADIHILCGYAPAAGFTATPFRGTPNGTLTLREQWGEPVWALTYPEAAQRGVISIPTAETWPLVDDDLIEIERGELVASRVEAATKSKLNHVVELVAKFVTDGMWDKPTMFSLPSRETAALLSDQLGACGLPAVRVDGETPHVERQAAFSSCVERRAALVQIDVVSEGIDLPIRRLIDLSPTLSPVKWLQRLGRITRPGGESDYLCTNRNLIRHGYLLEGCMPPAAMIAAQKAFEGPTKRAASRAIGLESLGKFKPTIVPLNNGLVATAYSVSSVEQFSRVDYVCIVHPCKQDVLWASRTNRKGSVSLIYEKWSKCDPPVDLAGFASTTPSAVSEKQLAWWKSAGRRYGLDHEAKIDRKTFAVLPVLSDLRVKL